MGLDQFAYKRDANRLHGWMEELWEDKGRPFEGNLDDLNDSFGSSFNCVPVELTLEDLDQLEKDINEKVLPETGGFFFGTDSFDWEDNEGNPPKENDYYYKETDLEFIRDAREAIANGQKVYYSSWW